MRNTFHFLMALFIMTYCGFMGGYEKCRHDEAKVITHSATLAFKSPCSIVERDPDGNIIESITGAEMAARDRAFNDGWESGEAKALASKNIGITILNAPPMTMEDPLPKWTPLLWYGGNNQVIGYVDKYGHFHGDLNACMATMIRVYEPAWTPGKSYEELHK